MHYSPTEAFRACERMVRLHAPLLLRIGAVDEEKKERKPIIGMRHLEPAEIAGMRAAHAKGENIAAIARNFGVSWKTAHKYCRGKGKADGKM